MLRPGLPDFPELDGADALDLAEPLRVPGQDVDRPGAECPDDALGQHGADPLDQARGQELFNPLGRGGQRQGEMVHLELPAETRVELPLAADAEHLARRQRREAPDDGQHLPALGKEPADRVAVVGITEDDLVDGAVDVFPAGDERRLLHEILMTISS